MQNSNELAQLGAKVIMLISDAMMYAWKLFIGQLTVLLATPWHTLPAVKILLVALIVIAIVALIGRFIAPIVHLLSSIGAFVSYALATLFLFGLVAATANWIVRTIPNSSVALN